MTPRWLLLLPALAACAAGPDDTSEGSLALSDGTPEAYGVLAFLNGPEATLPVLDDDVGLDARAAKNIVAYEQTKKLQTIAELDAIAYVGPAAMDKLLDYVEAHGGVPDELIEGVPFTGAQATAVLLVANGATAAELDTGARLDSRAARAIVAARPIADLEHLAAVSYVGSSALAKLIAYAPSWHGAGCSLAMTSSSASAATDWNTLVELGASGDFGPGGQVIVYRATCVDGTSAAGQDAIVAAVRAALQGRWAVPDAPVSHGPVGAGGAAFVGLIATMRDLLDSRVEGGWNPNADPTAAALWGHVDALQTALTAAPTASPAGFVGVTFATAAEECSEHAAATIELSTGTVWIARIAPRC